MSAEVVGVRYVMMQIYFGGREGGAVVVDDGDGGDGDSSSGLCGCKDDMKEGEDDDDDNDNRYYESKSWLALCAVTWIPWHDEATRSGEQGAKGSRV